MAGSERHIEGGRRELPRHGEFSQNATSKKERLIEDIDRVLKKANCEELDLIYGFASRLVE